MQMLLLPQLLKHICTIFTWMGQLGLAPCLHSGCCRCCTCIRCCCQVLGLVGLVCLQQAVQLGICQCHVDVLIVQDGLHVLLHPNSERARCEALCLSVAWQLLLLTVMQL